MKILNNIKALAITSTLLAGIAAPQMLYSQTVTKPDTFTRTVKPEGTFDKTFLAGAPDSEIVIAGEKQLATIVVDLKTNVLYKYNESGEPEAAYLIASGKSSTPTHTGVRIVTHTEKYPYRTAPTNSKRRRNPRDYGPKILCLNKLDPKTGEQSVTGEFIHGCRNENCLGKYVSHGCMRMANDVITELADIVKPGSIVVIKR